MRVLIRLQPAPFPAPEPASQGHPGLHVLLALLVLGAAAPARAVTITEILYRPGPLSPGSEALEFVEIFNDSSVVADLSGATFSDGVEFTFADETYLPPFAYLLVCSSVERVRSVLGDVPAVGDFRGQLDNGGERLRLLDARGSPLCDVRYSDRGAWPAAADGTGCSLSLRTPFLDPTRSESWTWSARVGGTPGRQNFPPPSIRDTVLVADSGPDSVWTYRGGWNETDQTLEAFSSPPDAWRLVGFDDSGWREGPLPIGFGEPDVATVLDDMVRRYVAFAARRTISLRLDELGGSDRLLLVVRVDDGCVAWVNGQEIGRVRMAGDAGDDVSVDATATQTVEFRLTPPVELEIPRDVLIEGENVLAVELHNVSLDSEDAVLAVSVLKRAIQEFDGPPEPSVVIHEVRSVGAPAERFVELLNASSEPVTISGSIVSSEPDGQSGYELPPGSVLPAGALLAIDEPTLGFSLARAPVRVFLLSPERDRVQDAFQIDPPEAPPEGAWSHGLAPEGHGTWWVSRQPTPGGPNIVSVERDLVFHEIHYHPRLLDLDGRPVRDSRRGEFLEIFNRSTRSIALGEFRVAGGIEFAFPPESVAPPGGYIVVARDPESVRRTYGLPPQRVLGPPPGATEAELSAFGALSNSGETVRLVDALGNTVDEVTYGEDGDWPSLADGGGSSLELVDARADNALALAWAASDDCSEAPWVEIAYEAQHRTDLPPLPTESEIHIHLLAAGECLIDSVSVTAGDPPQEYVANGDFESDTAPWRLTGTHGRSSRSTADSREGSASLHVVATGSGDTGVNHIEVDTMRSLPEGPVRIRFWARWLRGSNALHFGGHNNSFGKTVWLPVPERAGTPGRPNEATRRRIAEVGSANLGPVIASVRHEPAVPGPEDSVRVRAIVRDPDGGTTADVVYEIDGTERIERAPLRDDGMYGDSRAGDGEYVAVLPPQPEGTIVRFHVEASDGEGALGVYPRKSSEHFPVYVVDAPVESSVLRYRLVIDSRNRLEPERGLDARPLHSDELVRGTFILEESEVYYDVGIRYRGSPFNRPLQPRSFRIQFPGDRRLGGRAKRINLSSYGFTQKEATAYHLIEKSSVPWARTPTTPRYQYVRVELNADRHGTVMAEIHPVDDEYAEFNWPDDSDGHAWKLTGKLAFDDAGRLRGDPDPTVLRMYRDGPYPETDSSENYRYYYNPSIREDEDVFEPLVRLLKTMDRSVTPDDEYDDAIEQILNVEASLRVFAVRSFLADWDSIDLGNGQNTYLYFAPAEGRHYLVPWDLDRTFEYPDLPLLPEPATHGLGRLLERPRYRRLFARILAELMEGPGSEESVLLWTGRVDEVARTAFVAPPTQILEFLQKRRPVVQAFLASGTGFEFEVTTPSPVSAISGALVLEGRAPLEVATLTLTIPGLPDRILRPEWSSSPAEPAALPTRWRIAERGLPPDLREAYIVALDRDAQVLATTRIEILPPGPTETFVRGEVDGVEGASITDAVVILEYLFRRGSIACRDAADVNDDGSISISDPIRLLLYLFQGHEPPPSPYPEKGSDLTPDALDCGR